MVKIAAKALGGLALPDACPRCFWVKNQMSKMPYSIFPGVFFTIDSYVKKFTTVHYEMFGKLPSWIEEFCGGPGRPLPLPKRGTFQMMHPSGVQLTGMPDEVIRLDGSGDLVIPDYKTSKVTDKQDTLLPMYQVQGNVYARIAEATGMGKVAKIGLIYYEPLGDMDPLILPKVALPDGFNMQMRRFCKPLERNDAQLDLLVKKAHDILAAPVAPASRLGCEDCERLAQLVALAGRVQQ